MIVSPEGKGNKRGVFLLRRGKILEDILFPLLALRGGKRKERNFPLFRQEGGGGGRAFRSIFY